MPEENLLTGMSSAYDDCHAASPHAAEGDRTVNPDGTPKEIGCANCWPPSADEAWEARSSLPVTAELIDESHFHVTLRKCPACAQSFVSIFTETIDWVDGDDPQYWTLKPITPAEAADLVPQGGSLTEASIDALGSGRRCLQHDHPKGEEARSYWRPR